MGGIPFTVYDFFGYLSSGAVFVALGDFTLGYHAVFKDKLPPAMWAILVMIAYVTGHAVAHLSAILFENIFVTRILGRPSETLLAQSSRGWVLRRLFSNYFRPLPKETRERIREQAALRGFGGTGESLFLHALPLVVRDEKNQKRLDEFRNLYGFARNMAFTLIITSLVLYGSVVQTNQTSIRPLAACAAALAVIMLYRYLKFFRQYSYQLFVTYAELNDARSSSATSASA